MNKRSLGKLKVLHLCEDLWGSVRAYPPLMQELCSPRSELAEAASPALITLTALKKKRKRRWLCFLSKPTTLSVHSADTHSWICFTHSLHFSTEVIFFLKGSENEPSASFLEHWILRPSSPSPRVTTTKDQSYIQWERRCSKLMSRNFNYTAALQYPSTLHRVNLLQCAAHADKAAPFYHCHVTSKVRWGSVNPANDSWSVLKFWILFLSHRLQNSV